MKRITKGLAVLVGLQIIVVQSLAIKFSDNTVGTSAISEGKNLPTLAQIKLSNSEIAYGVVVSQKVNNPRGMTEVLVLTGYPFTKDQADEVFSFTIHGKTYSIDFSKEALDENGAKRGYFFRGISEDLDKDVIVSQLGAYSKNPHDRAMAKDDFDSFEEYFTTAVYEKEVYVHGLIKSSDGSVSSAKAVGMGFYDNDSSSFQLSYRTTNFFLEKEDCSQPVYVLSDAKKYILVGFLGRDVHLNQPAKRSTFVTLNRCNYKEMFIRAREHATDQGFVIPKQEVMAFQKNDALFSRGALIGSRWILTAADRNVFLYLVQFLGQSPIKVKKIHQLKSNDKLYLVELVSSVSGIAPVKRLQLPNDADGIEAFLWKKHLITTKNKDPKSYYTQTVDQLHEGTTAIEAFSLAALEGKVSGISFPYGIEFMFLPRGTNPFGFGIDSALQGSFVNEKKPANDGNPSCIVNPDNVNDFALIGIRTHSLLHTVDKGMATKLENALILSKSSMLPSTKNKIEQMIWALKNLREDQRTYGALLREADSLGLDIVDDLINHFSTYLESRILLNNINNAQFESKMTFMSNKVNQEIESITGIPAVDRLDSPYPAVSISSSTSSSTSSTTSTGSISTTTTTTSTSTSASSFSVHIFNSSEDVHFDPSFMLIFSSSMPSGLFKVQMGSRQVMAKSLYKSKDFCLTALDEPVLDPLTALPGNLSLSQKTELMNAMIAWALES